MGPRSHGTALIVRAPEPLAEPTRGSRPYVALRHITVARWLLEPMIMAKILVVDDQPSIVRLLERVLQTDAHEVMTASDGEEALQRVRRECPALVFLDVTMPKKNGYEVLRTLKSNPATLRIPVILLTGRDQDSEMAQGLQLGADWYVSKPFRPGDILTLARRFLDAGPASEAPAADRARV